VGESSTQPHAGRFRVLDLDIDLGSQTVWRKGEMVPLPDLSFRLLAALVAHAPDTLGKDDLIREVWGNVIVGDETLAQRVRLLRQALGDDAKDPRYVISVRGRGYRLVGEPAGASPSEAPHKGKWLWAATVAGIVVATLLWLVVSGTPERPEERRTNSIAVLPFMDLSSDQSYRYFADGMQDELLTHLSHMGGIAVMSRTSVEAYRSTDMSLPAIAEQLGVNFVIEGSIRVQSDRVRITVQLIDAMSDHHLWAENYDRELSVQNILSIQQDVADRIASSLALKTQTSYAPRTLELPTASLEAYQAYLLGRYHTFQQTSENLWLAVGYLEQAIALDSEFAEAYAALGWAYAFLGTDYGGQPPVEVYPKAKKAATSALALDSELADAKSLYADILTWFDWDFEAAEREYLKAMKLDPLNVLGYAMFLSTQERHEEAIALVEKRMEATPKDAYVRINAAWRFLNARQYARAILEANFSNRHTDAKSILGYAYLALGDTTQAIEILDADLQEQGRNARQLANLALAYYEAGRISEGSQLLAELQELADETFVSPALIAMVFFAAKDADSGFALLQDAVTARCRDVIFFRISRVLDEYRDDPRYTRIKDAIGY
jgi:TolB-like protein/DNA-binding winged helix-turn-helix (wHTH) protein/Tfp pilus assembly protein PilF